MSPPIGEGWLPTSGSPYWGQWPGTRWIWHKLAYLTQTNDDLPTKIAMVWGWYTSVSQEAPAMCKTPGRLSAHAILPNTHKRLTRHAQYSSRYSNAPICSVALNKPRHTTPQAMVMGQYFRAFGEWQSGSRSTRDRSTNSWGVEKKW